jgi:hypothetical protein
MSPIPSHSLPQLDQPAEVTFHQGGWESQPQGKGAQVSAAAAKGGRRNAKRHNFRTAICNVLLRSGTGERDALKLACPVQGGADRKGLYVQHQAFGLLDFRHPFIEMEDCTR